jgi:crotonobetainyl-CoA:carnitine CoA-transferase CaiB-like acyl-CoA transferase
MRNINANPADAAYGLLCEMNKIAASLESELTSTGTDNATARHLVAIAAEKVGAAADALDHMSLALGRGGMAQGEASDAAHAQITSIDAVQALIRAAVAAGARAELTEQADKAETIAQGLDELSLHLNHG